MQSGVTTAHGLLSTIVSDEAQPRLMFVALGEPTLPNPVAAFRQGLHDAPADRAFLIRGQRCSACGFLELYATEATIS
jgi:hypothetical protein